MGQMALGFAALAAGDGAAAHEAREAALQYPIVVSGGTAVWRRIWNAEAALADRNLTAARRWADEGGHPPDLIVSRLGLGGHLAELCGGSG